MSRDLDTLTSWHADWTGLRVAVLGLSVTGFSVADTLTELGAEVLVLSESASEEYQRLVSLIGARLWIGDLGSVPERLVEFAPEVVIASPGFAPAHPVIVWTQAQSIALWGDVELGWRVRDKVLRDDGTPAEWVLITGTNGKTTTTQLTATMLAAGGLRAAPCGNIGVPVLDAVRDPGGFDVLVVELSSHQLWYLGLTAPAAQPVPWAATCLNLADDHLVWHGSAEAYRDAKALVYRNTRVACVYNKADAATQRMVEEADVVDGARAIGFGLGIPGPSDLGVVEGILADRAFLDDRHRSALELTTVADLAVHGLDAPHVVQNILAAAALSRSLGVEPASIKAALDGFRLDAHRIEVVARAGGITWVDDSKATNPHAAQSSLRAFPGAVWIVGGDLKGVDLSDLVAGAGATARAAVVIGVDRGHLLEAFARHAPAVPVLEVVPGDTEEVMTRVVELAAGIAQDGDTVLLAPAAASFDQFAGYADRGHRFAEAVRQWIEQDRSSEQGAPVTPLGTRPTPTSEARIDGLAARVRLGRVFRPLSTEFALIASSSLLLTLFGLVMILSASSANAVDQGKGPFSIVLLQALVAAVGVPLMFLMSRFPVRFWKRMAWPLLILSVGAQLLVYTPLGVENDGNTNWLNVGGQLLEPSEFIKLSLAIWAGFILWRKQPLLGRWQHVFIPLLPVAFLAIGSVYGGGDLGTSMVLFLLLLGAMFFSGVRMRVFLLPLLIIVAAVLVFALTNERRRMLIFSIFSTQSDTSCYLTTCYQQVHAIWGMANGGVFGLGLGNSREKYGWLPAASNDYIFAIVGEELGLIGCALVLALFVLFAVAVFRMIRRTDDLFVRVTSGAIVVWILSQALINIGVVLRIFPVLGVPLPFMSQGGTSLLSVLLACGVLLSFARTLPAAARSTRADRSGTLGK